LLLFFFYSSEQLYPLLSTEVVRKVVIAAQKGDQNK